MKHLSRFKGRLRRPSPGTILGLLALMVALGGTAAANLPGRGSVNSGDIKNGAVKAIDIKTGAVLAEELASGAVQDEELGTIVARVDVTALGDGVSGTAEASCLAGEKLIGGGGHFQSNVADAALRGSYPSTGGNGIIPLDGGTFDAWAVTGQNVAGAPSAGNLDLKAWALCLQ